MNTIIVIGRNSIVTRKTGEFINFFSVNLNTPVYTVESRLLNLKSDKNQLDSYIFRVLNLKYDSNEFEGMRKKFERQGFRESTV